MSESLFLLSSSGRAGFPRALAVSVLLTGDSYESYDGIERPPQPYNLTVHPYRNSLLLRWQSRPPQVAEAHVDARHLRRPADYYVVQYRTVGQWVPLADRVVDRTSYNWTTASRGATYHFRVIAYYDPPPPDVASDDDEDVEDPFTDVPRPVASIPSPVITFHTGGAPGLFSTTVGSRWTVLVLVGYF